MYYQGGDDEGGGWRHAQEGYQCDTLIGVDAYSPPYPQFLHASFVTTLPHARCTTSPFDLPRGLTPYLGQYVLAFGQSLRGGNRSIANTFHLTQ